MDRGIPDYQLQFQFSLDIFKLDF